MGEKSLWDVNAELGLSLLQLSQLPGYLKKLKCLKTTIIPLSVTLEQKFIKFIN